MKNVKINELRPGMILAKPILNGSGFVELLCAGTELTIKHIDMLKKLNVQEMYIEADSGPLDIEIDIEEIIKAASQNGQKLDGDSLKNSYAEIEGQAYDPATHSVVNKNMEVHFITGENDKPIDVRQKKAVEDIKTVFEDVRVTGALDLNKVKASVEKMIPDMIRNDDVMMRINQLKGTDDYTFDHSLRVSILATMIGKWLGYEMEELVEIGQAGLLFDIGKLKIPDYMLRAKKELLPKEYEFMKKHAQFGYSILLKTQGISDHVKYAALQHHERIDGSGYPFRIKNNQIREISKIIMICDVFDALLTGSGEQEGVSPIVACDYLSWVSGKLFDSKITYVLIKNLAEYYVGKTAILSTGQTGTIVYLDANYPTKPLIKIGEEFLDLSKTEDVKILEVI